MEGPEAKLKAFKAVGGREGRGGKGEGEKRKELAKGPIPPRGSIVKGRREVPDVVSSLIRIEPVVLVVSRLVNFEPSAAR